MPRYDYKCKTCGAVREVSHRITEKPAVRCAECRRRCVRLVSPCSFSLRGRGWASDGYASAP